MQSLTRSQYCRQNKLPFISITHKLKPELPVVTHLLQSTLRLGTQIQKLESQKGASNLMNLELANAIKIINELEDELEMVTSKCNDYQDEVLVHQSNVRELETKVRNNEETIASLQHILQSNEFMAKSKLERENEYFNNILNQYERKYEEMNEAYEQLKFDRQKELQKAKTFHEDHLLQINMKARQYENSAQSDIKQLQQEIEKEISLNTLLRQKITDIETQNQGQIRNLERTNTQLCLTIFKLKSEHEHITTSLNIQLGLSQNKIKELEDAVELSKRQLRKQKGLWHQDKRDLEYRCQRAEKSHKDFFSSTKTQMGRVVDLLTKKTGLLSASLKQESSLKSQIQRLETIVANLTQSKQRIAQDHQRLSRKNQDLEQEIEKYSSLPRGSSQKDLQENENYFMKQKLIMANEYAEYRQKAQAQIAQFQKNEEERILSFEKLQSQLIFLSNKLEETKLTSQKIVQEKARESQQLCLLKDQLRQMEAVLKDEKETFILHVSQLQVTKNNLENLLLQANQKLHNFSQEHQKLLYEKNAQIQSLRNIQRVESAQPLKTEKEDENQDKIASEANEENLIKLVTEPSQILEHKLSQKTRKLEEQVRCINGQKLALQGALAQLHEETEQRIMAVRSELAFHYQNSIQLKEKEVHELKNQCIKAKQLEEQMNRKQEWFSQEKQKLVSDLFQKNEENCCLRIQLEALIEESDTKTRQKQLLNSSWKTIFENLGLNLENNKKIEMEQAQFQKVSRQLESEKRQRTQRSNRSWKSGRIFYSMVKNSPKTHEKGTDENQNENNFSKMDQKCSYNHQSHNDKLQKSIDMIASELYSVEPYSTIKKHVVRLKNSYEEKDLQENSSIISNQEAF